MASYRVPDENLPALEGRIEELNRRARRLKLREIELRRTGREDVPLVIPAHLSTTLDARAVHEATPDHPQTEDEEVVGFRRYHLVEIEGEDPVLAGWKFAATLVHLPQNGELDAPLCVVRAVPGEAIPAQYREAVASNCDHCRTNVRRRDTYLLRNLESGEHKQVGSTCLRDFLGHGDPHAMARYAELLGELAAAAEEAEDPDLLLGEGGFPVKFYGLLKYVEAAAAAIREEGWVSRRKAEDEALYPTAERVLDIIYQRPGQDPKEGPQVGPEDTKLAEAAIEWAKALDPSGTDSDFLHNLHAVAKTGVIEDRMVGLAAALVPCFQRAVAKEIEQDELANSKHVGQEGQKIELEAKVTLLLPLESPYGAKLLVKMVSGGNALVWFCSGNPQDTDGNGFDVGRTYQVRATVKAHGDFRGILQTVLTRAKLTEIWS